MSSARREVIRLKQKRLERLVSEAAILKTKLKRIRHEQDLVISDLVSNQLEASRLEEEIRRIRNELPDENAS